MKLWRLTVATLILLSAGCGTTQGLPASTYRWTEFVSVRGQPNPVPAEWVSTPEGAFAHSLVIPNPVPLGDGYRVGIGSDEYFEHLCKTQAGEWIYKTVYGVDGFYFMRPPKPPADKDLMDRYKLEDPYTERFYQLRIDDLPYRPAQFVNPPYQLYRYVEEPRRSVSWQSHVHTSFVRMYGYRQGPHSASAMRADGVEAITSRYAVTWRGLAINQGREHGIAGGELIVLDRQSDKVLGVLRNYVISGGVRGAADGIWWLNAKSCPQFPHDYQDILGKHIYLFISKVIQPMSSIR